MAGNKVVSGSSCINTEKVHQIGACNINLSAEDEFVESIEYIPCPDFQFSVSQLESIF